MSDTIAPVQRRFLSTEDTAAYVGLSVSRLANMRSLNEGPRYVKRGNRVRYLVEDLDAWIVGR